MNYTTDKFKKYEEALACEAYHNKKYVKRSDFSIPLSQEEQTTVNNVNTLGYHVIPDFYSTEKCQTVIKEINRVQEEYKNKLWVDECNSDHRLYAANRVSSIIDEFSFKKNEFINNITRALYQTETISNSVMAAHLIPKSGNLGSGGGWHRDRAESREIKVILYLNDVTEKNGPFQYYEGTHLPKSVLSCVIGLDYGKDQHRYTQEEVNKLDPRLLVTAVAKAGTLLIADVRGMHRGMPIQEGERYILMNYSLDKKEMPEHQKSLEVLDSNYSLS